MNRFLVSILILTLMMLSLPIHAQDLTVRAMSMNVGDLSASTFERKDLAKNPCALVKVQLAAYGAQFEGNVVGDVAYKTGEYWVYMTEGSKELRIKHPNFVPLHVNFSDYSINGVTAKQTYTLTLVIPQTIGMDMDDGMRYLAMTVEPTNATVYIDNNLQTLENGTLSLLLPMGQHEYRVEAQAYETKTGTFTIGYETLQLPIKLESAMASLSINSTTQGTQIYVNDQMKGTSSWSGSLRPGTYRVEGRLQGYRNHRQNITLAQRDRQQLTIPALQAITGVLNVNYQPLNAEVWIDGKKVGASPNVFRNIIIGNHNVELRAEGYTSKQERVNIEEGKTSTLTGTLSKISTAQTSNSTSSGQSTGKIIVSSFNLLETDLTANTYSTQKRDKNGETAALIKIATTEKNFQFDGGSLEIVGIEQKPSEIWLYVPPKAQKLTIKHPEYGECREYHYPLSIVGGRTYEMQLKTNDGRSLSPTMNCSSFKLLEDDLTANTYGTKKSDMNGETTALIKIFTSEKGFTFDGSSLGIVATEEHTGEIWIYVPRRAQRLTIQHPKYGILRGYRYPLPIEGGRTYEMLLDGISEKGRTSTQPSSVSTPTSGNSLETITVNGVSFNMVRVEGGTFLMGNNDTDAESDEKPVHQVTLSDYYIGETEVTQELWQAVMGSTIQQQFNKENTGKLIQGIGANHPIAYISWYECQEFVSKLNEKTGRKFRLPTEAEWEYAARGGNKSHGYNYSGSNNIDDVAWYTKTTNDKGTRDVKTKQPNELGLYDMSGNVSEWCQDLMGKYIKKSQTNPTGPANQDGKYNHVIRGGGWDCNTNPCKVSIRRFRMLYSRYDDLGLRLAL